MVSLYSCEGETTYTTRIVNHTDEVLGLQIFHQYEGSPEAFSLLPNKSYTLFLEARKGGNESIPNCVEGLDSLSVFLFSGKSMTKDFLDPNAWNHQMISSSHGGLVDHYCDFEIYQSDLHFDSTQFSSARRN